MTDLGNMMQAKFIIDKNIIKYLIYSEESVINALKKISENKSRMVFVVDESGQLEGVVTDGDVRRWLVSEKEIDLNCAVSEMSNKEFKSVVEGTGFQDVQELFSEKIQFIPLVDDRGRVTGVISPRKSAMRVGSFEISALSPTFIIAEIGINHNGSVDSAKRMVREAKKAGADCVKFQMRDLSSLYRDMASHSSGEDLGVQYTMDLLNKFHLRKELMLEIFDDCREQGILALCTPWDVESLRILEEYGMPAYKVASADLTNHELLKALSETGKPLICSTGMSTEGEIKESVELLNRGGAQFVLLHCNSTYPAPYKDIHLKYMERLKELGGGLVGYSGHERGHEIPLAAVALGARVIEKHFTLDKSQEGNDHKVSLLPNEFSEMVRHIRNLEQAMGNSDERKVTQGEMMNRNTLAKSLVSTSTISMGQVITSEMIEVKSPGRGLQPNALGQLVGKRARREMKVGDFFFPSDIETNVVEPRPYNVRRPWGVPVRYHDYKTILPKSNVDFLEFHLSYKDMDLEVEHHFDQVCDKDFTVHSPDLFADDHLLNLCAEGASYRQRSIDELKRVVDITHRLKSFFPKTERPFIIVSVGGSSKTGHVSEDEKKRMYELIDDSLQQIDSEGVEILPQTLPPFPWYFGGQLYSNIFVNPKDTDQFCKDFGYRLCFDISHSKLACNHYNWSFSDLIDTLAPHTAHLHLGDSEGVDGEGLQIGEGDVDFIDLLKRIDQHCPKAWFIPEIWQGHINDGEGFWAAMERLEKLNY